MSAELRRLLHEQVFDLRRLDVTGFRRWLELHGGRWGADEVLTLKARIRELRRANPRLRELEAALRAAREAFERTPEAPRLRQVADEMHDTQRAIDGLTAALDTAAAEKRPALREKLADFTAWREALCGTICRLQESSPEWLAFRDAHRQRAGLYVRAGLLHLEAELAHLQRQRGQRSGRGGREFEEAARRVIRLRIIRDVTRAADVRILNGVTLGAARTEFDYLIVRPRDDGPVDVLAAVEVKRNINDLAHGLRRRQEDFVWLTGDTASYDPDTYRTRHFRTGHFDRPATHREGDAEFIFDRTSFRRFHRDPGTGFFLGRLYFVTRPGPVWGASAANLARIAARVASDERFDPNDDTYLRSLLRWSKSLTEETETPDVLSLYAAEPRRGRRILLVE